MTTTTPMMTMMVRLIDSISHQDSFIPNDDKRAKFQFTFLTTGSDMIKFTALIMSNQLKVVKK